MGLADGAGDAVVRGRWTVRPFAIFAVADGAMPKAAVAAAAPSRLDRTRLFLITDRSRPVTFLPAG